ncbi:rhomboid family intramembrane serine protease [Frigoriflavimonas asaccharolytica]|uniref:Membrane associated rhomboid family serine protease n=1 Tax=Frigoriflavimonas asaccharolytica TaxID=2735899 RepID=A0A8J8G804_9FLAO|nr:rhomboid family intramembrane serine protease [Frigoriflavimonas asaccharolytica]NRS92858.1 membrane associated rhomboid family serine protease [Frigoriflavimonas asaccharolytica]
MDTILIITIAITAIISYISFDKRNGYFEKYKFNVSAILYKKEYIRLLSAGFLHADFMHLGFNMLTLYFFGPIVVSAFGDVGFVVTYIGSILLGNIFSLFLYKNQGWYSAIGASGGVSGILFASIAMYPMIMINFIIPGFVFGFLYFAYSVYAMLNPKQNDNIGHSAHLAGAFFGLVYAVSLQPEVAMSNAIYIGVMALPLLYMGYEVFINKKIR